MDNTLRQKRLGMLSKEIVAELKQLKRLYSNMTIKELHQRVTASTKFADITYDDFEEALGPKIKPLKAKPKVSAKKSAGQVIFQYTNLLSEVRKIAGAHPDIPEIGLLYTEHLKLYKDIV